MKDWDESAVIKGDFCGLAVNTDSAAQPSG